MAASRGPTASPGGRPRRARSGYRPRRPDTGPGIIETSLVIGLAGLLAVAILVFFGGSVADLIGQVVDAAHGGR
jgi:hypothetical protein